MGTCAATLLEQINTTAARNCCVTRGSTTYYIRSFVTISCEIVRVEVCAPHAEILPARLWRARVPDSDTDFHCSNYPDCTRKSVRAQRRKYSTDRKTPYYTLTRLALKPLVAATPACPNALQQHGRHCCHWHRH